MADKDRVVVAEVIKKSGNISGQMRDVVIRYLRRARRIAVAALVGHDDVIASRRQGRHLMTPGKGVLWPAVAQDNRIAFLFLTGFENLEGHTVDVHECGRRELGGV